MNHKIPINLSFLFIPFVISSCYVASSMQSARLVKPGTYEVTPSFSSVTYAAADTSLKLSNNFGGQLETGLQEDMDLVFRYEHIVPDQSDMSRLHFISFTPKMRVLNEYVALCAPLGFYFGNDIKTKDSWQLHPTLIGTVPINQYAEINFAPKWMIFLDPNTKNMIVLNMGLGISSNFAQWSVKPEFSYVFSGAEAEHLISLNIGLTLVIPQGTQKDSVQNAGK
jgi:hypothetical protein